MGDQCATSSSTSLSSMISSNVLRRQLDNARTRGKCCWFLIFSAAFLACYHYYYGASKLLSKSEKAATNGKFFQPIERNSENDDGNTEISKNTAFTTENALGNDSYWPDKFSAEFEGKTYEGRPFSPESIILVRKLMADFGSIFEPVGKDQLDENQYWATDEQVLLKEPIFVSAFSSNHFDEALTMLSKLKLVYGARKTMIIYDIGLRPNEREQLVDNYDDVTVELKTFPFDNYPQHVQTLWHYRWKPLIIAAEMSRHGAVLWMDTSTVHKQHLGELFEKFKRCSNHTEKCPFHPWMMFDYTGHSIFAATHATMFDYLPMPEDVKKSRAMLGANVQLAYGTRSNVRRVLYFWLLCALQHDCMAPERSQLYCNFGPDRFNTTGHCHRFDQSAVNILLQWLVRFDLARIYSSVLSRWIVVERG